MQKSDIKLLYILLGVFVFYSVLISFYFFDLNILYTKVFNKEFFVQKKSKIKIDRNFLNKNIILKDYSNVDFKIEEEGKKIIQNIRDFHKSPSLVNQDYQDKEVCAGYIWLLSEKIWGKAIPYYIGMMNQKSKTPAKSWELPNFYINFGGKNLIDFSNTFSLKEMNFWEKTNSGSIKKFFSLAFSEESLFGDIGFLYKDSKYVGFLDGWAYNSHITKNIGVSNFEIMLNKDYETSPHLEIISDSFGCNKNIQNNYFDILKNYELYLNGKKIILKDKKFYFFNQDNTLGKKVNFKYLDKITYSDITLAHFFDKTARIDSLFNFICRGDFFPINITSINPRFIEKM